MEVSCGKVIGKAAMDVSYNGFAEVWWIGLLSPATVLMKICMVSTASADEARDRIEESLLMLLMLLERAILTGVVF